MSKKRWGIIGLGRISNRHIDAIKALGDEVVATCDNDESKNATYTNYYDLIADERVDAVAICTPNYLHTAMAMDCVTAGKPCVVEKPVGLDHMEAVALSDYARMKDVAVYPVLQVRFNPVLQYLKDLLKSGKLGKVYSVSGTVRWNRPQEYFDESPWKGKKELDGGCLLTQGIHYLDVMTWLFGSPDALQSTKATLAHDIEVEDYVAALMRFGDVQGIFEFSVNSYQHNTECSLSIISEKGNIKIGGTAMNTIELWEVENIPKPALSEGRTPNVYAGGLYQGSCPNHEDVYRSIQEGKAIPIQEALTVIKVIDQIYGK